MSDIQLLVGIISNILQSNDQNLRKNSENQLIQLRTQKPNELVHAFLLILEGNYKVEHRNFSASQLRLILSRFSPKTYSNIWETLNPEIREAVKIKLFEIIYKEADLSMKKHIADTLGEIAGSILYENHEAWPEFKKHMWTLLSEENVNSNLAAFYILETFFNYVPEFFKSDVYNLYTLFKNAMAHENPKLKLSAINCFSSFLEVLDIKEQGTFQELVIPIYEAVYWLFTKDNQNEEGIETLSEMIDVEPKFFKKKFKELHDLLKAIFNLPDTEPGVKRQVTEILVDFSEKFPALFRKKTEIMQSMIEMIFYHMVGIANEITQEWKVPPEGYNEDMEDDEDFETTRFGMSAIDRIIYSIGEEEVLPVLSATIEKLLAHEDWRYKYTAVMALSQVGEYIEKPEKVSSVIGMIGGFLKHTNPMMRYAACHAIGQISDDMQPKFQEMYGAALYPQLLALMTDDVPRVAAHSSAALTNFLEGMKFKQISPTMDQLMEMLIHHATSGISLVKQSALSTISSVVELAKEHFVKYLEKTVEVLFNHFSDSKYSSKQYKQLKGQSIETLTIIASSVGADLFRPYAEKLIELLIVLQSSQFEQTDPQKNYIMAGWQRLCLVYGRDLAGYLNRILPSLFTLVEAVIKNELNVVLNPSTEEQKNEKIDKNAKDSENINTYETEEAQIAISMLNVFIEQLKDLYAPYVEKTVQLLCIIISDHPNADVKDQACKCLPNLISVVKSSNQPVAVEMAKYFMKTLVDSVEKEYDSEVIEMLLETLKNIIQELDLCFLSEQQVMAFSQKILKLLKDSDSKKQTSANLQFQLQVDEDDKNVIDEEIKQEEEVQVAISELIGILFKTHKGMALNLANYCITNILPGIFKEGANMSENMNKFGIFLIDDMVEFLGYETLQGQWAEFGQILKKFTQSKSPILRQAACYGMGIFSKSTPTDKITGEVVQLWLHTLVESIKIPKGSEKEKVYGHCRDNGVASIGKVLKAHGSLLDASPYLALWLTFLPMRFDKPQAIQQHQFLADIMINRSELILGQQEEHKVERMSKVINLYGQMLDNPKITNQIVKQKIKTHLSLLNSDENWQAKLVPIWNKLSEKHKTNLNNLMKPN